jgi:hypothetical protein
MTRPRQPKPPPSWEPKWAPPWVPPDAQLPDVVAIKALAEGGATPEQQKRALHFIMVEVAGVDLEQYCPTSDRDTAYALGKRRVGTYLRSLLAADIRKFKSDGQPSQQVT